MYTYWVAINNNDDVEKNDNKFHLFDKWRKQNWINSLFKADQHCLLEVNLTVKQNWKALSSLYHTMLHQTISIWELAFEGNSTKFSQFVLFFCRAFGFHF